MNTSEVVILRGGAGQNPARQSASSPFASSASSSYHTPRSSKMTAFCQLPDQIREVGLEDQIRRNDTWSVFAD